mmetsp:Transcript_49831/g.93292  ORF Transcript_49831/g.93292 Transcript_49831/m.93292 type:complete len:147 (+) Transcript_49831:168-608(+)
MAYARYLGFDPVAHHDLMWIALKALEAPLPADWTEHFDSHDRVFFYHALKRASKWTHSLEYLYREAYTTCVDFQTSNLSLKKKVDKLRMLQKDIQQFETFIHKQISQWTEQTDPAGAVKHLDRPSACVLQQAILENEDIAPTSVRG